MTSEHYTPSIKAAVSHGVGNGKVLPLQQDF